MSIKINNSGTVTGAIDLPDYPFTMLSYFKAVETGIGRSEFFLLHPVGADTTHHSHNLNTNDSLRAGWKPAAGISSKRLPNTINPMTDFTTWWAIASTIEADGITVGLNVWSGVGANPTLFTSYEPAGSTLDGTFGSMGKVLIGDATVTKFIEVQEVVLIDKVLTTGELSSWVHGVSAPEANLPGNILFYQPLVTGYNEPTSVGTVTPLNPSTHTVESTDGPVMNVSICCDLCDILRTPFGMISGTEGNIGRVDISSFDLTFAGIENDGCDECNQFNVTHTVGVATGGSSHFGGVDCVGHKEYAEACFAKESPQVDIDWAITVESGEVFFKATMESQGGGHKQSYFGTIDFEKNFGHGPIWESGSPGGIHMITGDIPLVNYDNRGCENSGTTLFIGNPVTGMRSCPEIDLSIETDLDNPNFDIADDWTFSTGWYHNTGSNPNRATHTGTLAGTLSQTVNPALVSGSWYKVAFAVTGQTQGSITPVLGGTEGTAIASNGPVVINMQAGGGTDLEFIATNSTVSDGSITPYDDPLTPDWMNDIIVFANCECCNCIIETLEISFDGTLGGLLNEEDSGCHTGDCLDLNSTWHVDSFNGLRNSPTVFPNAKCAGESTSTSPCGNFCDITVAWKLDCLGDFDLLTVVMQDEAEQNCERLYEIGYVPFSRLYGPRVDGDCDGPYLTGAVNSDGGYLSRLCSGPETCVVIGAECISKPPCDENEPCDDPANNDLNCHVEFFDNDGCSACDSITSDYLLKEDLRDCPLFFGGDCHWSGGTGGFGCDEGIAIEFCISCGEFPTAELSVASSENVYIWNRELVSGEGFPISFEEGDIWLSGVGGDCGISKNPIVSIN